MKTSGKANRIHKPTQFHIINFNDVEFRGVFYLDAAFYYGFTDVKTRITIQPPGMFPLCAPEQLAIKNERGLFEFRISAKDLHTKLTSDEIGPFIVGRSSKHVKIEVCVD